MRSPRNWLKGSIRANNFLGVIPQGKVTSNPPPEFCLDSVIQGKYAGSACTLQNYQHTPVYQQPQQLCLCPLAPHWGGKQLGTNNDFTTVWGYFFEYPQFFSEFWGNLSWTQDKKSWESHSSTEIDQIKGHVHAHPHPPPPSHQVGDPNFDQSLYARVEGECFSYSLIFMIRVSQPFAPTFPPPMPWTYLPCKNTHWSVTRWKGC